MAFCTSCGSQTSENGVCPECSPASVVPPPPPPPPPQFQQAPPPPPPPQQYQQQPPQQYQQQQFVRQPQAQQNPIVADGIGTIKKFLSPDPTAATEFAVSSQAHSWVIVAGVSILIMALALMLIPAGLIGMELSGSEARMAADMFHDYVISRGSLFGYGLAIFAASFFLWACLGKGVFAISKVNTPFVAVLNLTAASFLPSALAFAAAILFSFFYVQASMFVILVGAVISVVLFYTGITRAAQFQNSPFWVFTGAYAVYLLVMYFVLDQLGKNMFDGALSNFF